MPRFSQSSFSKLTTCHQDLQVLFHEVVKSFDCKVLEGYRNKEQQEEAYAFGHSKLHWPNGKHNHQPSIAVDVVPFPIDWDNTKRFYWFGGYVMGIARRLKDEGKMMHSVRFGGDWDGDKEVDDESFRDLCHFELVL
jgi:peptidoglycan L-alanyl-D-glutamate endopeptidase CwlK